MLKEKKLLLISFLTFEFIKAVYAALYTHEPMYLHLLRFGIFFVYSLLVFAAIKEHVIPTFIIDFIIFMTGSFMTGVAIFGAIVLAKQSFIVTDYQSIIIMILGALVGIYFIYASIKVFSIQKNLCKQKRGKIEVTP